MSDFIRLTKTTLINVDLIQTVEIQGKVIKSKMITFDNQTEFTTEEKAQEFYDFLQKRKEQPEND